MTYTLHIRSNKKLAELKRKSEDTETRLTLLSGQLNPHFLYNSLNAIQGTINNGNPERANAYIGHVAKFMRDVMDNGKKNSCRYARSLPLKKII
ncbi:histidine kinase [Mucilaginibacter antarcticus]|uniref:histidine kinase n=1 Tax=Mucilaginibacter antarcticus TaxID=1855725 RepID=UPI0036331B9C